jgi:hypothetical protein
MIRITGGLACAVLLAATAAQARLPSAAPPLPPPDPGSFTIFHVDTAQELADACWNLASNRAIGDAPLRRRLRDGEHLGMVADGAVEASSHRDAL